MTKILLITPCFSREASTGIIALKNLQDLGHDVKVWDPLITSLPPKGEFDISITWINKIIDLSLVKAKKKILYYLEDNEYILKRGKKELSLDDREKGDYDYIFTMNETPGYEDRWIPLGADTELFYPMENKRIHNSVVFIGTGRDNYRKNFVKELQQRLKNEGISFYIVGNGWDGFDNWVGGALYYGDFVNALNKFDICINLHAGNLSPSDKVHAIIACGGALLINDNKDSYRKCYPMAPVWNTIEGCVESIKYFLSHEDERKELVTKMRERCVENYTYKVGLQKMLEKVGV